MLDTFILVTLHIIYAHQILFISQTCLTDYYPYFFHAPHPTTVVLLPTPAIPFTSYLSTSLPLYFAPE